MAEPELSAKRCPSCGAKNRERFDFCVRCGALLSATPPPAASSPALENVGLVAVGIVALVLGLAVFRWLATGSSPESSRPPADAPSAEAGLPGSGSERRGDGSDFSEAARIMREGMAAYEARDFPTALQHFEELARLSPDNPTAHLYAGLCRIRSGEVEQGKEDLMRAVELQPSNELALASLVPLLIQEGDLPGAEAFQARLVQQNRREPGPLIGLGRIHRQQGRTEQAIEEHKRAVDLDPTNQEALLELGVSLLEAEQAGEAAEVFQRATEIDDSNPSVHAGLGGALLSAKKYSEAAAALEESVRLDPDRAPVRLHLAMAYENMDRIEDSLREYEAFVRLTDDEQKAAQISELVEQARAALAEKQRK